MNDFFFYRILFICYCYHYEGHWSANGDFGGLYTCTFAWFSRLVFWLFLFFFNFCSYMPFKVITFVIRFTSLATNMFSEPGLKHNYVRKYKLYCVIDIIAIITIFVIISFNIIIITIIPLPFYVKSHAQFLLWCKMVLKFWIEPTCRLVLSSTLFPTRTINESFVWPHFSFSASSIQSGTLSNEPQFVTSKQTKITWQSRR